MRTHPPPICRMAPVLAAALVAASATPPAPLIGQDTAAVRIQREQQELERLRAETRRIQAETEKTRAETRRTNAETANLRNFFLRFLPVSAALVALVGGAVGILKYLGERRAAQRAEITGRVSMLLSQLGDENVQARVSAATGLGVIVAVHGQEFPELARQVAAALFGQMAQVGISESEQSTFANVMNTLLAGRTELIAAPPKGTNLSHVKFDGLVLRNVPLEKTRLSNASFRGATLDVVTLQDLSATGTSFEGSIITDASFTDCTLTDVSFHGATTGRLTFQRCTLQNCDFTNLPGTPGLVFAECHALAGLTFEGTDVSRLKIRAAGDVARNTRTALRNAKGIEKATLDPELAEKLAAEKT